LLEDRENLYSSDDIGEALKIKTHYENLDIAKSNKVHYLAFSINNELPKEKDEQLKELFREQTIE
jgi:tRNA (guanine-N7-)-methyltransferase